MPESQICIFLPELQKREGGRGAWGFRERGERGEA